MKQINVYFDDEEFKRMKEEKGDKTWHDFFLEIIELKGGAD